jgi:hypothetical protein
MVLIPIKPAYKYTGVIILFASLSTICEGWVPTPSPGYMKLIKGSPVQAYQRKVRNMVAMNAASSAPQLRLDGKVPVREDTQANGSSLSQEADKIFQLSLGMYKKCIDLPQPPNTDDLLVAAQLLDQVFELDFQALRASHYERGRARTVHNVSCMQPADEGTSFT